jgi:hypothetical protein
VATAADLTEGDHMKHVKMLCLGALATAALLALAGAGTASATVICKNNLNTETCSEPWPVGTEGTASLASGTSATLTDTTGNTLNTCTKSTVTGKLQSQGKGAPAFSTLTTLTLENCFFVTKTVNPGSGELTWIKGTDNGTLVTRNTEVTINTSLFGSCIYGTGSGTDMGTTVGGNPGSININTIVTRLGTNFACPTTAIFTAKYVATSPTNAWVSNG